MRGDLTESETVLADPQVRAVIDMSEPVAVIMAAVVHFLSVDQAAAVCAQYRDGRRTGGETRLRAGRRRRQIPEQRREVAQHQNRPGDVGHGRGEYPAGDLALPAEDQAGDQAG
jgi:S-adenosyl methyltransferase